MKKDKLYKAKFAYIHLCLIILTSFLTLVSVKQLSQIAFEAKGNIPHITRSEPLDTLANEFHIRVYDQYHLKECLPILAEEHAKFNVHYQHCTKKALDLDGNSEVLTSTFTVEEAHARKYNFWRRIYSVFDSNHYVIHSSEYPEVIFEVLQIKRENNFGPIAQRRFVDRTERKQKRLYRHLLLKMHQHREVAFEHLTPSMKRIHRLMAHIENKHKYKIAANSIRTQRGQKDFIEKGLVKFKQYESAINDEFNKQNIPTELAKISFVESSFNIYAKSKAGASGVFQIMPATGKQYLKVTDEIDERNDPIKAARAAAKLFKMNYNLSKDWPIAVTAYNHGIGSMMRAMRKVGSKNLSTIIEKYNHRSFGFASKNFYTEFLGILGTLKGADKVFPNISKVAPLSFKTIKLRKWTKFNKIMNKHSVSMTQIKSMNPDISSNAIRSGGLPKGYEIKIPVKIKDFSKKELSSSN